jgi:outer membrane protein assembly factor BamB
MLQVLPLAAMRTARILVGPLAVAAVAVALAGPAMGEDWPCWRGPRGDGTSTDSGAPIHWNGTAGAEENIAWRVDVPGTGHASPIVAGGRVFLVSALADSHERLLVCLDRADGKPLWTRTVLTAPFERKHALNSFASGTPAADRDRVYCAFLDGDQMLVAAYDHEGHPLWEVRPGRFSSVHGFCSCPVLFEDLVIVNGDHDGDSYLVALDRATGETRWKVPRQHKTRSYVTPIVRQIDGRTQMILSGSLSVTSYDPRTGDLHWYIDGPTEQFVASIVYNGELLFMTCGYPEHHLLAIRPDGSGNVTDTHVAWRETKGASYVPSPIAAGDYFLVVSDDGVASCFEADSGERLWMERIGTHYSASLVSAGGLVYFLDDDGLMKVVRPGPDLEVVGENPLGEPTYASPAVSDGQIFLRSESGLYCIGTAR